MSRTSIPDLHETYRDGEPLTMLTAYDAPIARQVEDAMVIGDMPFGSYGQSMETAVDNAVRFLKEAGADAVKLETAPHGDTTIEIIDRLTELGIPVQGHIGLTPQRMNQIGGAYIQGRDTSSSAATDALVETAERLVDAGVFAVVLETVTEGTGKAVTEAIDVPTIGIGAGRHVDGQVLVITDLLGLGGESFSLSKRYADVGSTIRTAVESYVEEVADGEFPAEENVYDSLETR